MKRVLFVSVLLSAMACGAAPSPATTTTTSTAPAQNCLPEDVDGFEDDDGCVDPDDDHDGIEDAADRCPREPEDRDGVDDEDGCPDADDADGDRIVDADDACPNEAETYNGNEDEDGCPDRGGCCPDDPRIVILDRIYFVRHGLRPSRPDTSAILDAVAATLTAHRTMLRRVEVVGHAESGERRRDELSRERAQWVFDELVRRGVDATQLTQGGVGARRRPEVARDALRDVGFRVVETSGEFEPEESELAPPALH